MKARDREAVRRDLERNLLRDLAPTLRKLRRAEVELHREIRRELLNPTTTKEAPS